MTKIPRAGDHVHHRPTDETWVVAYVEGDRLGWCGWPEGEAKLSDCELVKECSDEEHVDLLEKLANAGGSRASHAQAELKRRAHLTHSRR